MTRPSLSNGDIWSQSLANAAITPFIATTVLDSDAAGGIPPVTDAQLDSTPGQIKSNFYLWYDRIKCSAGSGLTVNYTGGTVLSPSGSTLTFGSGSVILPNNAANFIFVSSAGTVSVAPSLPDICFPLALATTSGGAITSLTDIRYQVVDQIRPVNLPTIQSPWSPGDTKTTFRTTPEPGWLFCHGQSLQVSEYPALFSAIGYSFGGSGSVFNLPDTRGRSVIGAGQGSGLTNRAYGSYGGAESKQLSVAEMPSHNHGLNDNGHIHGVVDPGHSHSAVDGGHSHTILDPGHQHPITDPGHVHRIELMRAAALNADSNDGVGAEYSNQGQGGQPITDSRTTGISVRTASTGITNSIGFAALTVSSTRTNIGVQSNATGITVQNQGGNAAFSMMNPYVAGNVMIKY